MSFELKAPLCESKTVYKTVEKTVYKSVDKNSDITKRNQRKILAMIKEQPDISVKLWQTFLR